ncbi:MAG: response regulator [Gemmatimonadota bacterium]|nr:response regulator [Gemmatimonadota bacterium]
MSDVQAVRKPTIVVVDDEAAIRNAMTRFFERRGWRCIQAADGGEAEAVLFTEGTRTEVDVVLCDVRLPIKTGLELFQRATAERPDLAGRWVLSSGDTEGVDVTCPVLAKPFPLAEVASMADAILSRNLAA